MKIKNKYKLGKISSGGREVINNYLTRYNNSKVLFINSHHLSIRGLINIYKFNNLPIIHRVAGSMAFCRSGFLGIIDDFVVYNINKIADFTIFQSNWSRATNLAQMEKNNFDTSYLINNSTVINNPANNIKDVKRKTVSNKRIGIVLSNDNPLKGFSDTLQIINYIKNITYI